MTPEVRELAFMAGAEAMRSKCAAYAMMQGNIPLATDLLNLPVPKFSVPEVVIIPSPECVCFQHKSGESTGGWWCPAHGQQF